MLVLNAVVYAKDARRLAGFYASVLGLAEVEAGDGFIRLAGAGFELTLVQASAALADAIVIAQPPEVREATPVKLSFGVPAIEGQRAVIDSLGGGLQAAASAWDWHGARHLDGWDPEGNVFQLRERSGGGAARALRSTRPGTGGTAAGRRRVR